MPEIIPTLLKLKLPQRLSYPLGAKAISDALAGVPQFDHLRVRFWFSNRLQRTVNSPYQVLSVGYSWVTYWPLEDRRRGWVIRVDAVPRPLRHLIQGKLVATALPAVRAWLAASSPSIEREGSHGLKFLYDELADELTSDDYSTLEWRTERV